MLLGAAFLQVFGHYSSIDYKNDVRAGELVQLAGALILALSINVGFVLHSNQRSQRNSLVMQFAKDVLTAADNYDIVIDRHHKESPLSADAIHSILSAKTTLSNAIYLLGQALGDEAARNRTGFKALEEARIEYNTILDDPYPHHFSDTIKREQGRHHLAIKKAVLAIMNTAIGA